MSSLVKLFPKYKYLAVEQENIPFVTPTSDMLGAQIPGKFTLLNGREAGKDVEDSVQLNQVVKIIPAFPISSKRYTLLVSYNPLLAEVGLVNCPSVIQPKEEIAIVVKALKNFDINEFTEKYAFVIYAID